MKLLKELTFCYKGGRTYVHGTDIFNNIFDSITNATGNYIFKNTDITIRKITTKNMVISTLSDIPLGTEPNVVVSMNLNGEEFKVGLIETKEEINCRYPYAEDEIIAKSHLNPLQQEIRLRDYHQFSMIERLVALNKELLTKLFPDLQGKWFFTRIKLAEIDWKTWSRDAADILLKFKKNLQNRITDSIIILNNKEVGHIYFSLIKS